MIMRFEIQTKDTKRQAGPLTIRRPNQAQWLLLLGQHHVFPQFQTVPNHSMAASFRDDLTIDKLPQLIIRQVNCIGLNLA
jgi:hypothetical protein